MQLQFVCVCFQILCVVTRPMEITNASKEVTEGFENVLKADSNEIQQKMSEHKIGSSSLENEKYLETYNQGRSLALDSSKDETVDKMKFLKTDSPTSSAESKPAACLPHENTEQAKNPEDYSQRITDPGPPREGNVQPSNEVGNWSMDFGEKSNSVVNKKIKYLLEKIKLRDSRTKNTIDFDCHAEELGRRIKNSKFYKNTRDIVRSTGKSQPTQNKPKKTIIHSSGSPTNEGSGSSGQDSPAEDGFLKQTQEGVQQLQQEVDQSQQSLEQFQQGAQELQQAAGQYFQETQEPRPEVLLNDGLNTMMGGDEDTNNRVVEFFIALGKSPVKMYNWFKELEIELPELEGCGNCLAEVAGEVAKYTTKPILDCGECFCTFLGCCCEAILNGDNKDHHDPTLE
ncbi:hypothetical protein CROQUDRAFT_681172 [Cronartium quercuum f. sp. fusiforme G11]|uniref:Uncharacterized protein n=1 Tax=Cronartium quercuum f. sp. fusiforme G11 TaxID=708437 RepID=A0A9P6NFF1_9BASI|nr:hypothetical protein CROQUDRAFT_681172 [Cronartium quercuum f. sp. fusiforme G11]